MGLIGRMIVHRPARKRIRELTHRFANAKPEARAGALYYLWVQRGINVASLIGKDEYVNMPIYYYKRNAEAALGAVMNSLLRSLTPVAGAALEVHYYTNYAVTYPDLGYSRPVRALWNAILENHAPLSQVMEAMRANLESPTTQEYIANNGLDLETFIENPGSIMPHFLVPGHPLTAELLEQDKAADYIGDQLGDWA